MKLPNCEWVIILFAQKIFWNLWLAYNFCFISSHWILIFETFILNTLFEFWSDFMIKIFFKYISFSILLPDILQEGSVVRVLEVLSGPFVEARVKQSALTQLSVMTEDSRLHQVFIDQSGVEVFIKMLHKVVVSRICILKDY